MGFDFSIIDVDELNALTGEDRDQGILNFASSRPRCHIKVTTNKNSYMVKTKDAITKVSKKGGYDLEGFNKRKSFVHSKGYVSNVSHQSPEIRLLSLNGVPVASPRFSDLIKSDGVDGEYSESSIRTLRRIYNEVRNASLSPLSQLASFMRRMVKELDFLTPVVHSAYTFLVGLANVAKKIGASFQTFLSWIYDIHGVFEGADVTCDQKGHYIISPPGTGKTFHNHMWSLGLIDTDGLNSLTLDKKPTILNDLLKAGFSIISNRWEWNVIDTPVYIGPKMEDLEKHLINEGFRKDFDPMVDKVRKNVKEFFKKNRSKLKPGEPIPHKGIRGDLEKWMKAYEGVSDAVPTYFCTVNSFLEAYSDFLDDLIV